LGSRADASLHLPVQEVGLIEAQMILIRGSREVRLPRNFSEYVRYLIRKYVILHHNSVTVGKLAFILSFILSVFPADAKENRQHIHVVKRGDKHSHRGDTVAKIWIEENGEKKNTSGLVEIVGSG
jgi:hypothetical protein